MPVSVSANPDSRVSGSHSSSSDSEFTIQNSQFTIVPSTIARPLNLLAYQRRWLDDASPLKLVVKARQIGYSFAATLCAVLECLKRRTTWIFLSKGERQSRLLMEKVQDHIRSCGLVARTCESTFFEGTMIRQLEVRFSNGSVIYGLPANPDTARGYSGHVTLDEFAFHADAHKIYAALFPTITRGYSLEVISTPNGTQGKFYELAKAAGLADAGAGIRGSGLGNKTLTPNPQPLTPNSWSSHSCDIYEAVEQGLKIDLPLLRSGCEDESAWLQEFCCQFVSTAENFIPPDLLAACLSSEARTDVPITTLVASGAKSRQSAERSRQQEEGESTRQRASHKAMGNSEFTIQNSEFFLGIDIGRHHDRTVFWLDEQVPGAVYQVPGNPPDTWHQTPDTSLVPLARSGNSEFGIQNSEFTIHYSPFTISIARLVRTFADTPFSDQLAFARELLSLRNARDQFLVRRAAIDSTGMGAPLAESLAAEFGPRVEPVVFTAAVKEDLAYRTRRRMEARLTLLPDTREIRRAFSAIKRLVTPSGNFRFDAVRSDSGHADEFWAKTLADLAADSAPVARAADGFLADAAPIIQPSAFLESDSAFSFSEI